MVVASGDAGTTMPEEQKRELAATGCVKYPRDASVPLPADYYVLVYDRRCETAPKYTVNVSVQDSMMPAGPGNALVIEAADTSYASAQKLEVFVFVPPKRRELQIFIDGHARVLRHTSPVHGLVISLPPDSLRGRY